VIYVSEDPNADADHTGGEGDDLGGGINYSNSDAGGEGDDLGGGIDITGGEGDYLGGVNC
jgi:hypothetical protein